MNNPALRMASTTGVRYGASNAREKREKKIAAVNPV
jgi:hypothetical protein